MEQLNPPVSFNESFERCLNDLSFLDEFYEIFLSSSDEVYQMFKDTEVETQKVMLMTSLVYMSRSQNSNSDLLLNIAKKHNEKNLNIKPHLYSLWLDSLVAAAYSIDLLFDESTEKLWRETLKPGIDYMISKYDRAD